MCNSVNIKLHKLINNDSITDLEPLLSWFG